MSARVEALFAAALERSERERQDFVERESGADIELRAEVLSLLRHDASAGNFLATPASGELAGVGDGERAPPAPPASIGGYDVESVLGEGGMGVVYLARQRHPPRTVALKVLRADLATPGFLRRFEREAEILGRLEHPGIARIYEAGTYAGLDGPQPFFAMELVRGRSIVEHARELDLRARLSLFADACDAVHYAHLCGVVHRDLKPANLLVDTSTGAPRVKVLDFGIARAADAPARDGAAPDGDSALDASSARASSTPPAFTAAGQIVGTLAYMSPEQARSDGHVSALDARADVYSLGVVLYELAAGRVPLELESLPLPDALRKLREVVPARLGTLDRALAGDVEAIAAKALEKDSARRYASAGELAAELRRFLADEPVDARAPSSLYQASKFARRHRALVGACAAVLLALVCGILGTTWQALRAGEERDRYLAQFERAQRRELEAREAQRETQAQRELADAEAERARGVARWFQDMLLRALPEDSGRDVRLLDVVERSARSLPGSLAGSPRIELDVRSTIGLTYGSLGSLARAEEMFRTARELARARFGERSVEFLGVLAHLGDVHLRQDRLREAEDELRTAHTGLARLLGEADEDALDALSNLGLLEQRLGRAVDAEATLRRVLAIRARLATPPDEVQARAQGNLGYLLNELGRFDEAEPVLQSALALELATVGEEHPSTLLTLNNLAGLVRARGCEEDALALYTRGLGIARRLLGDEHPTTLTLLNNRALVLSTLGRHGEAQGDLRRALALAEQHWGARHVNTLVARGNLAQCLADAGETDVALSMHAELLDDMRATLGERDLRTLGQRYNLATLLVKTKRAAEALEDLEQVYRGALDELPSDHWQLHLFASAYGACLLELGQAGAAEPILRDGYERLQLTLGDEHPRTRRALEVLVSVYVAQGREADAQQCRERLRQTSSR